MAYLKLFLAYLKINLNSHLEYRFNVVLDFFANLVEVSIYIFFWRLFFTVTQDINGWKFEQLVSLVAFNSLIYGLVDVGIGGMIWNINEYIREGRIDFYLTLPKNVLAHLLISGTSVNRIGRLLVGLGYYLLFVPVNFYSLTLLVIGSLLGATVFLSWLIIFHSLTFWLGQSTLVWESLASLLEFARKPADIFQGIIRLTLYTILPAAFLGTVPVQMLYGFSPWRLLYFGLFAFGSLLGAIGIFYRGLRRYESGNLITVRM
ncbi:MAG TPA: ABC-2 family transporter protein [Candidatus Limnocylindrales bacterium]|nr:ABC-2 family transporter protein [Candidatus Limnocylindrales bacterium]